MKLVHIRSRVFCVNPLALIFRPLVLLKRHQPGEKPRYHSISDFRALKCISKSINYSNPNLLDIIGNLASVRYITYLDLQSGYYLIEMDKNCAAVNAFSGPHGHYKYTHSPMIIETTPKIFVKLLDLVFQGLISTDIRNPPYTKESLVNVIKLRYSVLI